MENDEHQQSESSSPGNKRNSLTNSEHEAIIAEAQAILTEFANLPLFIRNVQSEYDDALKRLPDYDPGARKTPEQLERELQEQIVRDTSLSLLPNVSRVFSHL